jgi:hypothetical protein
LDIDESAGLQGAVTEPTVSAGGSGLIRNDRKIA